MSPAPCGAFAGQACFSSCEGCFIWERFGGSRLLLGGGCARGAGGPRRFGVGMTSSSLSSSSSGTAGGSSTHISLMMLTSSPSSLSTRTRRTRSCVGWGARLLSVLPLDPPRECARRRGGAAAFAQHLLPGGLPRCGRCEGTGLPALCGRGRRPRPSCWGVDLCPPRSGRWEKLRRAHSLVSYRPLAHQPAGFDKAEPGQSVQRT